MYRFEHTNHYILLNILFQNHDKLILRVCNLHQKYLPCLGDYKNLIFWVIKFHWIFPNNPYIHMCIPFRKNKIKLLMSWLENVNVITNCFFKFF